MADARPRAYVLAQLTCAGVESKSGKNCLHKLHLNETEMTLRCPNMHCQRYGLDFEIPTVPLKRVSSPD